MSNVGTESRSTESRARGRILVVDDEEVVCRSCKRILEAQGFTVETCTDSRQGLRRALQTEHAAILLDVKMPAMSGIRFLEELRKHETDIPVLMITGFPSAGTEIAARRLGAACYLHKPFTPDEVTAAVLAALEPRDEAAANVERETLDHEQLRPWLPICDDYDFFGGSWLQLGRDGTARVGIFPSRTEAHGFEGLVLPRVGETLYRGLPLAGVSHRDGWSRTYPAPLSGDIVEVNAALYAGAHEAWDDPCLAAWVARVRPRHIIHDLWACSTRSVVLLGRDESLRDLERYWLERLGCAVFPVRSPRDAMRELRETDSPVLALDARSFGREGPRFASEINARLPEIRVIVLAGPGSELEAAYRRRRILYYAVEPFLCCELVDVVAAAFAQPATAGEASVAVSPPEWVDRMELTTRTGLSVVLVTAEPLLQADRGLGWQLERLAARSHFEVELRHGRRRARTGEVLAELAAHDRVLLLKRPPAARLPGSLAVRRTRDDNLRLDDRPGALVVLEVAPGSDEASPLVFDARTTEALAEHVLAEMTQEPPAPAR